MRPLVLKMAAFGPYGGVQHLDFTGLKGRNFFLIHGPTGAGKTTILDAICFALYGDTSGGQRDGRSMRSDHAEGDLLTEVVFDFAVGQVNYRVRRLPEQQRPKKRGEGMTVVPGEAALWRLSAEGEQLLFGKWTEVTQGIEGLLGFRCSQFRQVVLLPQGDFRRLLTANSNERQEILQALFKTEHYRYLEERLKEYAGQYRKQFEELTRERHWILKEAGADCCEALAESLQTHRRQYDAAFAARQLAQKSLEEAQAKVAAALVTQEKLAEQAAARQGLEQLMNAVPQIDEKRYKVQLAEKAAVLQELEKKLLAEGQDVAVQSQRLVESKQQAAKILEELRQAREWLAAQVGNAAERENLAQQLNFLRQAKKMAEALGEAKTQLTEKKAKADAAAINKEKSADKLAGIKNSLTQNKQQAAEFQQLAAETASCQAQYQEAQRLLEKREELEKAVQAATAAARKMEQATAQLSIAEQQYRKAQEQWQRLQMAWVQGQAALMAAALEEGAPCPVCGSSCHPALAVTKEKLPEEGQLKAQQVVVEKLGKAWEAQREVYQSLLLEAGLLQGKIVELQTVLGQYSHEPLTAMQALAQEKQAACQRAAAAQAYAGELAKQLEALESAEQHCLAATAKAEEDWRQADSLYRQAEAVYRDRLSALPEAYQEKAQVEQAIRAFEDREQQLKGALEEAGRQVVALEQQAARQEANLENITGQLAICQDKYEQTEREFTRRLSAAFASREEYYGAWQSLEEMIQLEEEIKVFEGEMAAAKDRVKRAQEGAEGLEVPQLEALKENTQILQEEHTSALASCMQLEAQLHREADWVQQVEKIQRQLEAVEAKFGVVGRLAEVANGGNEYKLTFQRFVLGSLLDDVTLSANQRLMLMSRGRYELQRTMDRARKNAAGGLELEVFDHHTGVSRSVDTLSGGETFLASLSLALGLADVVQAYAGGVHLETILVDEGFGTLDPEALDVAIKALVDLQQGGRLVGIISHVPELKERIDARLEVTFTKTGSKAAFKVG